MRESDHRVATRVTILFVLLTLPLRADVSDPLTGDAPALDATAPEATDFQQGDYGVAEQTGAVTYSFPIPVPPGRHSMEPKLELRYSSRAPLRGGVAAGWSLNLPSIRRDTSSGTTDDVVYSAVLGGTVGRLVAVPDISGLGGTTYRVEQDSTFTRFETFPVQDDAVPNAGEAPVVQVLGDDAPRQKGLVNPIVGEGLKVSPPDETTRTAWLVRTTDGKSHRFGGTSEATDGRSRWYLDRQEDASGNAILYHWEEVADGNGNVVDHCLKSIEYTANDPAGLMPHARIDFEYTTDLETCPESQVPVGASLSFRDSVRRYEGARRLVAIVTQVRDTPGSTWREVQRTTLRYDVDALSCEGPAAPLRLLSEIHRLSYAPDGTETPLPPVTFTYATWTDGEEELRVVTNQAPAHQGTNTELKSTLLDVNGDGLLDRVEIQTSPQGQCELVYYEGVFGGGYSNRGQLVGLPTMPWANGAMPQGDERCTLMGQITRRLNQDPPNACWKGNLNAYRFADIDGDGRVELLTNLLHDPLFYDPALDREVENPIDLRDEPGPEFVEERRTGDDLVLAQKAVRRQEAAKDVVAAPEDGAEEPPDVLYNRPGIRDYDESGEGLEVGGNFDDPDPDPEPPCTINERVPQKHAGGFVWRIYRNAGNSFVRVPHFPTIAKLPLTPGGNEGSRMGHGSLAFGSHAILDMDGDGHLDLVADDSNPEGWSTSWAVYPGDGEGGFGLPVRWSIPQATGVRPHLSERTLPTSTPVTAWTLSSLRDVNGDGLPDLVVSDKETDELHVFFNWGTGFSGAPATLAKSFTIDQTKTETVQGVPQRTFEYYPVDVDGDGLSDLLDLRGETPSFLPNVGDRFLTPARSLPGSWKEAARLLRKRDLYPEEADGEAEYGWDLTSDYSDADGDGLRDHVLWLGEEVEIRSRRRDAPPWRLVAIENGAGTSVEFSYSPVTHPSVVTRDSGDDRQLPHVLWIVDSVTVSDAFGVSSESQYHYADPVYGSESGRALDPRRFLGFQRITKQLPAGGAIVRDFEYAQDGDARGRLTGELRFDRDADGFLLVSERQIEWTQEALFEGRVRFVHKNAEWTVHCAGNGPECGEESDDVQHQKEVWESWVEPETGQIALYLRTESSRGVGYEPEERERQSVSEFEVRYTPEEYRVLPTETEVLGRKPSPNGETFERVALTTTTYDAAGLPQQTDRWVEDELFATTERVFDAATGNLLSVTRPQSVADGTELAQTFSYDAHQLFVAETTNELGHKVFTWYDVGTGALFERRGPKSKMVQEERVWATEIWHIDGLGRVVERSISVDDSESGYRSVVVAQTQYDDLEYHLRNKPRTIRDENLVEFDGSMWVESERQLDGRGRNLREAVLTEDGTPAVKTYHYGVDGGLSAIDVPDPTTDSGATVSYSYLRDGLGRLRQFSRPDGTGVEVRYEGRRRSVAEFAEEGTGMVSTTETDAFERLVRVEEQGSDGSAGICHYDYDAAGQLAEITDADGNTTHFEHDGLGLRTAIHRGVRSWRYGYNLNGNLLRETTPVPSDGNEFDYTTTYDYDALGRIVQQVPASRGLSAQRQRELGIGAIRYFYDSDAGAKPNAAGELSRVELPFGETEYAYDARGFVAREERSFQVEHLAVVSSKQWVERDFNALGLPTRVLHDDGTLWRRSYDARGLIQAVEWFERETNQGEPETFMRADVNGDSQQDLADAIGMLSYLFLGDISLPCADAVDADDSGAVDLSDPIALLGYLFLSGLEPSPPFSACGVDPTEDRLKCTGAPSCSDGSDAPAVLDPVSGMWQSVARYKRSLLGQVKERENDYGQLRLVDFDILGRPLGDEVRAAGAEVLWRSYEYDSYGNLGEVYGFTGDVSARATYTYDAQHRLLGASGPADYVGEFTYSPAGNVRTARVNGAGEATARDVTYEYGAVDPQAVDRLIDNDSGETWANFRYDLAGNVRERSTPLGKSTFRWDGQNQLREAETSQGREVYYYDHEANRVLAITTDVVRFWFGESETRFDSAGDVLTRYVHLQGLATTVGRVEENRSVELYYSDNRQNLMLSLDREGTPTGEFLYGAFGEAVYREGAQTHRRQFNGKEVDEATGLHYYGFRYYDPLILRWASADPLYEFIPELGLTTPRSMNRYAFSLNNPVRYYDPDGRDPLSVEGENYDDGADSTCEQEEAVCRGGGDDQTEAENPSVSSTDSNRRSAKDKELRAAMDKVGLDGFLLLTDDLGGVLSPSANGSSGAIADSAEDLAKAIEEGSVEDGIVAGLGISAAVTGKYSGIASKLGAKGAAKTLARFSGVVSVGLLIYDAVDLHLETKDWSRSQKESFARENFPYFQ